MTYEIQETQQEENDSMKKKEPVLTNRKETYKAHRQSSQGM